MKKIYNLFVTAAVATASLLTTSCIEETFPTDVVIEEQLSASDKATEAALWGMPAKMYACFEAVSTPTDEYHYDWGYGSMMHIRDVMGEEYAVTSSSYNWYNSWSQNYYLGDSYLTQQMILQTYYKQILTINNLIGTLEGKELSDVQQGYLGTGYAFRASQYLDAARMYEYLPTDGTSSVNANDNDVTGLTVPIVTNKTTPEESRNNPRATHYEMFDFIMSDLDKAEELLSTYGLNTDSKTLPNLSVVYGLKARTYLWQASFVKEGIDIYTKFGVGEDAEEVAKKQADATAQKAAALSANEYFAKAAEYAKMAIDVVGKDGLGKYSPLKEEQWTSTTTGFNSADNKSWMFCISIPTEADAVQSGIVNWTSWVSNETSFGYASAGPFAQVSKAFYDKISETDFRKLSFKAPGSTSATPYGRSFIDADLFDAIPDYGSLKFRPGNGNADDSKEGCAVDSPLMRIEEMYFILAEAQAQQGLADGATTLTNIMKTRDPQYSTNKTGDELVNEIIFQKMVEFWGEGLNYFDYKRLDMPITRVYKGSNFAQDELMNTTRRAAWMNFVFVRSEGNNNAALKNWNNPDPSDCYEVQLTNAKSRQSKAMKLSFKK